MKIGQKAANVRVCIKCQKQKDLSEFYKAGKHRYRTDCKTCCKRICADRTSKRDKRLKKNTELKYKYGITIGDYDRMLATQQGGCKICKETATVLAVDHCHKTGKVRGLLCNNCNHTLGLMKDSAELLSAAI